MRATSLIAGQVVLTLGSATWAAALPPYSVTDLGVSGGLLTGINDFGQVSGWTATPAGTRPFVWTPTLRNGTGGSISVPDGLLSGAATDAWGINASGQLVGRSNNKAVLWNPLSPNSGAFGPPVELTQPGGPPLSIAAGINASGQVTGRTGEMRTQAFLFTPSAPNGRSGSVIPLGTLPPSQVSFGSGLNNYGQVAGTSFGAFLWTPDVANGMSGQMTRLASALNSNQVPLSINNSGQVAGPYTQDNGAVTRSFLWTPDTPNGQTGSYVDLGTISGSTRVAAAGLNDHGEVVGDYGLAAGGFLWTHDTGIMDVNGLLDSTAAAWHIVHAYAINSSGQIGADAVLSQNGQTSDHFVLLTPDTLLPLLGDANGDGRVNFDDLLILAQNYGKPGGWPEGDFNSDASVGFDDLLLLAQHYGQGSAGAASSVPEPSCAAALWLGSLVALRRRR